jgi:hypothetical protein
MRWQPIAASGRRRQYSYFSKKLSFDALLLLNILLFVHRMTSATDVNLMADAAQCTNV